MYCTVREHICTVLYVNTHVLYIYDHISLSFSYNKKCFRQGLWRKSKHTFYAQYLFPKHVPFMR